MDRPLFSPQRHKEHKTPFVFPFFSLRLCAFVVNLYYDALSHRNLQKLLGDIPISHIPHKDFKRRTFEAKAIVRTGEFTPYANVILISGVVF